MSRVILTHPETGHVVAVDDWHVEHWEKQGYRAAGKKPVATPAALKRVRKPAKKSTARKR